MLKVIFALFVASILAACGGPSCSDPTLESQFITGCTSNNPPTGYCQCVQDYLFGRFSCSDLQAGNVTAAQILEGCQNCAPQYGLTCK